MSAWAQETITVSIYDDCSKNGKTEDIRSSSGEENGHTWVDLGLPSGIKWATCNVGATTPEGYGNYYAWGETEPKDDYSWATYKYTWGGYDDTFTKYCDDASKGDEGFIDNKMTLEPMDDAAHVNWGGKWRMPTDTEMQELLDNCTWTVTNKFHAYVCQVTSKTNGNSIFFPFPGFRDYDGFHNNDRGYYWSSSLGEGVPSAAWYLYINNTNPFCTGYNRSAGRSVRPVCPLSTSVLTLNVDGCENTNTIRCDAGQKISINAVPENAHRHFVRWTDGNTDNPRTVIVTQDTVFTAEFAIDRYTITASGEHGTVEGTGTYDYNTKVYLTAVPDRGYHFVKWSNGKTYNPLYVYARSNAHYTAEFAIDRHSITTYAQNGNVSGGGTYDYGTTATLTATADEHYHFTQWTDGNTDNPRIITVESDATYTAEFAIDQHTVTTYAQNGNVSGGGTYDYGTTATLTATADEHYHFTRWTDGNTDNPRTVAVEDNVTYTAEFKPNPHTITVSASEHGNVSGAGTYDYGTTATLTAVADEHYHFTRWTDGNTDNPRTVSVEGDATYTAEFAIDRHTITTNAQNGNVSGGGTYDYGTAITLTATANEHYHFTRWSDGNTDNPRTVSVEGDATYTAEFKPDSYTITVSASGHGSANGGGTYDYGTTATLTATADEHYHFTKWNDGNTDNPRTISVEGDATYTAEFAIDQHTITATCDPKQGNVTGAGMYDYGTQVTLTATANKGYEFSQWSNGANYNPYLFTATEDLTLEAQFVPATAVENISADGDTTVRKVFRDGQVLILRNGKTYTTTGVEVKQRPLQPLLRKERHNR